MTIVSYRGYLIQIFLAKEILFNFKTFQPCDISKTLVNFVDVSSYVKKTAVILNSAT